MEVIVKNEHETVTHTIEGDNLPERAARLAKSEASILLRRAEAIAAGQDPDIAEEARECGVSYEQVAEAYRTDDARRVAQRTAYEAAQRESMAEWDARRRQCEAIPTDADEMPIGAVQWQFETPGLIHIVDGASGAVPRWVRVLAARHWPDAGGIQVVRVRVICDQIDDSYGHSPRGIKHILLDLAPDRMGIDASSVANQLY